MYVKSQYHVARYTPGATGECLTHKECQELFGRPKWQLMLQEIEDKGSAILSRIVTCGNRDCGKSGQMNECWHHFEFRITGAHVYACSYRCAYTVLLIEWSNLDKKYAKLEQLLKEINNEL